jgi:hypothetical protein
MDHAYCDRELVVLRPGVQTLQPGGSVFVITRRLPASGLSHDAPQYLLENIRDGHQRVVQESLIEGRAVA